jgi:predicted nucleic acid-binding protein
MAVERIMDASLMAAVLFAEDHSDRARRCLSDELDAGHALIAPDLLALEIASIAAKKVWRGETSTTDGKAAIAATLDLVARPVGASDLAGRAFELAAAHRFSAYDAAYLALAEARACRIATLDDRLVRRAEQAGLSHLIHPVT